MATSLKYPQSSSLSHSSYSPPCLPTHSSFLTVLALLTFPRSLGPSQAMARVPHRLTGQYNPKSPLLTPRLHAHSLVFSVRGRKSGFGATCSEHPSLIPANFQAVCGGRSLPRLARSGRWRESKRWCLARKRPGAWTAHRVLNQARGRRRRAD